MSLTPTRSSASLLALVLTAPLTSEACAAPAPARGPVLWTISEPAAAEPAAPTAAEPVKLGPVRTTPGAGSKDDVSGPPPGMVLIRGGRTVIGSEVKDIEKMLEQHVAERRFAGAYIAETPQFKREVPEFALMVTEVTNEQFEAYVRATGSRPPEYWGKDAIDAARNEFLTEQGRRREEAKAKGEPIPDREKFDEQGWWRKNWETAEWAVPAGQEHRPVVFVDYEDSSNYALWAGLRLMDEFEYQRAVRGNGDDPWPWGSEWKAQHAVTQELGGLQQTSKVGSLPAGATSDGVYDLIGNAWEWTSSPFVEFPKYKEQTFEFGSGKDKDVVDALANWDANKRVCVGGCYHSSKLIARATTRRGASRDQTADAQSFRCAASLKPGIDIADRVMSAELDSGVRPANPDGAVQYAAADTLAVDRWHYRTPAEEDAPVPGYSVITGYDYVIFTPVDKVWGVDVNDLNKRIIEEGPEPLGFISTNQRILTPDLQPGTYMVSYRCPGKRRVEKEEAPEEGAEPVEKDRWDLGNYEQDHGLDPEKAYYLFFDRRAEIVGVVEAASFDKKSGSVSSAGSARFYDKDYVLEEKDDKGKITKTPVHEQWLRFDANIRARAARRGFAATIALQVETDLETSSFRVTTER